jgi:hypothetical protein
VMNSMGTEGSPGRIPSQDESVYINSPRRVTNIGGSPVVL